MKGGPRRSRASEGIEIHATLGSGVRWQATIHGRSCCAGSATFRLELLQSVEEGAAN
jgi:hypothetical protein